MADRLLPAPLFAAAGREDQRAECAHAECAHNEKSGPRKAGYRILQKMDTRRIIAIGAAAAGIIVLSHVRLPSFGPPVRPAHERTAMPDFTFPSLAGVPWRLSEYKGRIVFVNFWATWCPPCREETPGFVELHRRYGHQVEFLGVSMDDDPRLAVPPFAKQYGIQYTLLMASPEAPILNAVEVLPTSFLVGADGKVARAWAGMVPERDLATAIEALLRE